MSLTSINGLKQNNCILHWPGGVSTANAPKTITANGDAKQLLPFPGAGIGRFDGTGDYISTPASTELNIFNSDFTIETLVTFNSVAASCPLYGQYADANNGVTVYWDYANQIYLWGKSGGTIKFSYNCSFTPVVNTWYHIVVVRSGSACLMFINGVSQSVTTTTAFTTLADISAPVLIGNYNVIYHNGNLSEFRISNVARYTASFTPPYRQLQNDSNTKLLLHFLANNATFVDSSPSPKTITASGNATQLTSPCGSGIAAFDGTGDYLTAPYSADLYTNGDFTLECNVMWKSYPATDGYIVVINSGSAGNTALCLIETYNGQLAVSTHDGSARWVFGSTVSLNVQYHIAVVKTGTTLKLYVDGSYVNQYTGLGTITNSSGLSYVGRQANTTIPGYCNAYVSEVRFSNVARYTATFTPPTQPFRPDPNTKLLLHMDGIGAAFYDASDAPGDNGFTILPDGCTVTPSGTFTTQKMKNGRNIWKFDGSTNYVSLSDNAVWDIYANDFTVCFWINFGAISADFDVISQYNSSTSYTRLHWRQSANYFRFFSVTSTGVNGFIFRCDLASPPTNAWYHVTFVRSGSTGLIYFNGIKQTVTTDAAFDTSVTTIAANLLIGGFNNASTSNGNIKDLMIFKRALTLDQIWALMDDTFIY
jgi:hypothetical protein